jgi:hypothetical protein
MTCCYACPRLRELSPYLCGAATFGFITLLTVYIPPIRSHPSLNHQDSLEQHRRCNHNTKLSQTGRQVIFGIKFMTFRFLTNKISCKLDAEHGGIKGKRRNRFS